MKRSVAAMPVVVVVVREIEYKRLPSFLLERE
jgi:hypothetical protein